MLIEIDSTSTDDALGGTARSRDCIENFLRAHDARKHVVWLDREQISGLRTIIEHFSSPAREALHDIYWRKAEIRRLRERVRWLMRVGLGPAFDGSAATEAGKQIIRSPLHRFHDLERAGRSVMLGENLTSLSAQNR
jgi:hypothetical protein